VSSWVEMNVITYILYIYIFFFIQQRDILLNGLWGNPLKFLRIMKKNTGTL
jgi:hypothetical protein